MYGTEVSAELGGSKIAANNVAKRTYQKEYMEYWNNSKCITRTGRPVDAVISPVAPTPPPPPGTYKYYGYTTFVNLLDYSSCTVPVTTVDPGIDVKDENYKPHSEFDKSVAETCQCLLLFCENFCS